MIDNFEQIIAAAPVLAELLAVAPAVQMLVTSRALLHLKPEREFNVPPLALPDESNAAIEHLAENESIKLFAERAQSSKPNFLLTEENAATVAEICLKLEGLPLAIELAAARIKILSPAQILERLENRLKILTGGAKDLPTRQQTMRGAIEWSYDLLDENERVLFEQLAIFAGGFTIEAAEAVVEEEKRRKGEEEKRKMEDKSSSPLHSFTLSVLDGITALVENSLLVQTETTGGASRFRLLEIVREFALEKLETSGADETIRKNHAAFFLALAEKAQTNFYSEQAAVWLDQLEDEHDNFRAALDWSIVKDLETATNLTVNLRSFWLLHNHISEKRKWIETVLEKNAGIPDDLRIRLLYGLGQAALYQGDNQTAREMYRESLRLSEAAGDKRHISMANRGLGAAAKRLGDTAAAKKFIKEGLQVSRELDDKLGIAASLNGLGDLERLENNFAAARPFFEETLALADELGIRHRTGEILKNLGAVEYAENNFEAARKYYTKALLMEQKLGDKASVSYALDGFAALAVKQENFTFAARLAGAAEHLRELDGFETEPAEQCFRDAYLAELRSLMTEDVFKEIYHQGCQMKIENAVELALGGGF